MATANPISDIPAPTARPAPGLLVLLAAMPQEQSESVLASLTSSFPAEGLIVATPDEFPAESWPALRFLPIPATNATWTLTAADFLNAYRLAGENEAHAILMLGPRSASLAPAALTGLANAVLLASTDLAIPCYDLPPRAGLINSAILYPLTRALFASRARFPLAIDLGLSLRMAERLAAAAQRFTAVNQGDAATSAAPNAIAAQSQRGQDRSGSSTGTATQTSATVAASRSPVGVSPANAIQKARPQTSADQRAGPAVRSVSIADATQGRQP